MALPFYNIFIATIYCKSDVLSNVDITCYEGMHILHLVVAVR
jgi:hypothetical protein